MLSWSAMIEQTVLECQQHRFWASQRRCPPAARRQLRESDALMDFMEQCRIHRLRLVPAAAWRRVVFLVGSVDADLRHDLGINRGLDHVIEVLFETQGILMARNVDLRRPSPAKIIPLFRR